MVVENNQRKKFMSFMENSIKINVFVNNLKIMRANCENIILAKMGGNFE